jgi:uncharacterized protein
MIAAVVCAAAGAAHADDVAQPLPLVETWTDTTRLSTHRDWSRIPGITGRRGNNLTPGLDADPQGVLADGSHTEIDVRVNLGDPSGLVYNGIGELELADPMIALQAGPSADAPHLVIAIDTRGIGQVRVSYVVIDVDGSADDVAGAVALHYRIGDGGPFHNVPAAFVADATDGGRAGRRTGVDVTLPPDAGYQPRVELRILTTNRTGSDEWIGIDDLVIERGSDPYGRATVEPSAVAAGDAAQLVVEVVPGVAPTSTGLRVACDASAIGGPSLVLADDGDHGDGDAGDLVFGETIAVAATIAAGTYPVRCRIDDDQRRRADVAVDVEVIAVCGNAVVDAGEGCDDGGFEPGDGCDAACQVEDRDGDGVVDHDDNCPDDENPRQGDVDGDGVGDACDREPIDDRDGGCAAAPGGRGLGVALALALVAIGRRRRSVQGDGSRS